MNDLNRLSCYTGTRQDLETEFGRLNKKQQRYTVQGKLEEANRVGQLMSRHSAALCSSSNTYTDPSSGVKYWLCRGELKGGAASLKELIAECRKYTSSTPEKAAAVKELLGLLEKRNDSTVSPEDVSSYLSNALDKPNNSIFSVRIGKSNVRALFEKCKEYILAAIKEGPLPNSLDEAKAFEKQGHEYFKQFKFVEAIQAYQKCLAIWNRLEPDRLDFLLESFQKDFIEMGMGSDLNSELASGYLLLGKIYLALGKTEKASQEFEKGLLSVSQYIQKDLKVKWAYEMRGQILQMHGEDQKAFEPFDQELLSDPEYSKAKWAYEMRRQILQMQGEYQKAFEAFDQELLSDPGYLDVACCLLVFINSIGEKDLFEKISDCGGWGLEEALLISLFAGSIGGKFLFEGITEELKIKGQGSAQTADAEVEISQTEFEAGSSTNLEAISHLRREFRAKMAAQSEQIGALGSRLDKVEQRIDILDGRVMELKDSLSIVTHRMTSLNQQIAGMKKSNPLLDRLIAEKQRLQERERQIKIINHNEDRRHYFYALLSELEAAYLAAQVMETGKQQDQQSAKYRSAAKYAGTLLELIPLVGSIASKIVTGVATIADSRSNVKEKIEFMRIRNLSPTVNDFDQIALRVAVNFTLRNTAALVKLNGAKVPKDWKSKLKGLTGGVDGLMTSFLKDNETQAKVLGRLDAYKVLDHLQEDAIAENYAMQEEESGPTGRRRESIVGQIIADRVLSGGIQKIS
jgi:tetratricopeptide (TPR) repeat protein